MNLDPAIPHQICTQSKPKQSQFMETRKALADLGFR